VALLEGHRIGEISSNSYEDIVFTRLFGSLFAETLTFGILTPKSTQHLYEPKYTCHQNWVKVPSLVFEIWCAQGYREAQTHSRMDTPENRMPPVPKVFGGGAIK